MTLYDLKLSVPKHVKTMITQDFVDNLNQLEDEEGTEFAEHYKQNFISMSSVLKDGSYGMYDYKNAVMFVAHKLLDNSDIDAYMMTFPDRYQRLLDKYADFGDEDRIRGAKISPFVSAYKKGELVVKITEQSLVPARILNAPMFQTALNVQLELAMTARSEMVRATAANSLLTHLAQPEVAKIELDIGIKGVDEVQALRDEMRRLASQQKEAIIDGANTSLQIAESSLFIEGELDE